MGIKFITDKHLTYVVYDNMRKRDMLHMVDRAIDQAYLLGFKVAMKNTYYKIIYNDGTSFELSSAGTNGIFHRKNIKTIIKYVHPSAYIYGEYEANSFQRGLE